MSLGFFEALPAFQRKVMWKRAHTHFSKAEDREDFIQNTQEFLWRKWITQGRPTYNNAPSFYEINHACKSGINITKRSGLAGYDNNGARPIKFLNSDGEFLLYNLPQISWDRLTLYCVPTNPKDASQLLMRELISKDKKTTIRMTDKEMSDFWGFSQSSLGRIRRLARPLKLYIHKGNLYPSINHIMKKYKITEAAARWGTVKYEFYFKDTHE